MHALYVLRSFNNVVPFALVAETLSVHVTYRPAFCGWTLKLKLVDKEPA